MDHVRDPELMSVGPDEVVVTFVTEPGVEVVTRVGNAETVTTGPYHVARVGGLEPATEYPLTVDGLDADVDLPYLPSTVTTLERPAGALVATVATVNDLHFGEVECGRLEGWGEELVDRTFTAEPGDDPYPEVMNRAALDEILALGPDAVVAKGDLTSAGTEEELARFLDVYGALGERLHYVRGNHDAAISDTLAATGPFAVELPGVTLAVLDTARLGRYNGYLSAEQLGWLDALAAEADRPVLVFGHHNVWNLRSDHRNPGYFGLNPDDTEALVDVIARREAIVGYFAGHTHRNRVRRFEEARRVPLVEVACVKDYPGAWAEYRIYEGGYTQVVRRISSPRAMAWTEKTRHMFRGLYRDYALGPLHWRCFTEAF